jgi:hypothetical protein
VDETTSPDTLKIVPFTFTGTPITVNTGKVIAANPATKHIQAWDSSESDVSVQFDASGLFDQVIVEGAKRRSAFTVGQTAGWGYTLEAGWTGTLETEYEAAGSGEPDYPAAAEIDERRRRNAIVRGSDRLASVFGRYQLPANWNGTAGDGGGVTWYTVFPTDVAYGDPDDFDTAADIYRPSIGFLPTIPLLADMDYSLGVSGGDWVGTGDRHEEMAPIVLIETP